MRPFGRVVVVSLASMLVAAIGLAVAAGGPASSRYDLGQVTITQPQHQRSSPLREMPVSLRGVVAVPSGQGPHPVVVIVHGSYAFCTAPLVDDEIDPYPCPADEDLRQYEGFAYLAQALAHEGYVALVPDLSGEFNNGFGEPIPGDRATQLLDAHLDALERSEGLGPVPAGSADLRRLVVAGHSRGGPLAIRYVNDDRWATREPSALALIAPAGTPVDLTIPPDLPAALVVSTCDGDVGPEVGMRYLVDQLPAGRPSVTATLVVRGGTHNAFSTSLGPDPVARCEASEILAPGEQRGRLAAFLARFFDMALADGRS